MTTDLHDALRDADRRGWIASWYQDDSGRIRVLPIMGPPQIVRSLRQLQLITDLARRKAAMR